MTHQYQITGMTCGSCVARVKNELLKLGDILSADVKLESPQLTLTMNRHVPSSDLQAAITKAGPYKLSGSAHTEHEMEATEQRSSYWPIYLIFLFLLLITVLVPVVQNRFDWQHSMMKFMGGFFIIFSFFKFLDLKGFAEGYGTYDLIAGKFRLWGFIYPFVELALGIAFITGWEPVLTNLLTVLVMSVAAAGVIRSLARRSPFQCACLGTIFKLPLSRISLIEDLLMIAMSAGMLVVSGLN